MTENRADTAMTESRAETSIHPTALIDPTAQLGRGVRVGPYSIVESGVTIGDGTQIDGHVRVARGTQIGRDNRIWHGAVLGTEPQDLKYRNEPTVLEVGDRNVIREYATVHRGTAASGLTRVGNDCFIMAYTHVAHDCRIGSHVVLANSVNMAGHVEMEDWVVVGGLVPIHQFVRVGCHAMIGGGFRVPQDICPYALTAGYPLKTVGLNVVGLRRRGFSEAQITTLRLAFRILFQSQLNTTQALDRIAQEVEPTPEVKHLTDFVRDSKRGIAK